MNDIMDRVSKRLIEKLNGALDVPKSKAKDLLDCYLSDQMSEKQWQDHLRENDGLVQLYSEYDLSKLKSNDRYERLYEHFMNDDLSSD